MPGLGQVPVRLKGGRRKLLQLLQHGQVLVISLNGPVAARVELVVASLAEELGVAGGAAEAPVLLHDLLLDNVAHGRGQSCADLDRIVFETGSTKMGTIGMVPGQTAPSFAVWPIPLAPSRANLCESSTVRVHHIELVVNLVHAITYFGRDAFSKVILNRRASETMNR